MNSTPIKALLFDMGGVVLTVDFGQVFKSWAEITTLDEAELKSRFKMDTPYQQHEKGTITASQFFEHQRSTLELTGSDSEIVAGWNAIFESEIAENLDAIDLVRNKIPTYGFTNTNLTHQLYWEHHFPRVRNTFKKLFVSSEIGLRKPDAEAFHHVLNEISVKPEELLFFDDSEENIVGAEELGIKTVLVTDSASVISALKDFTWESARQKSAGGE